MSVLFIAGWSTPCGDFIKEHAFALANYANVEYVYIEFIKSKKHIPYKLLHHKRSERNITTHKVEIYCYLRRFKTYEVLIKKAFDKVIKDIRKNKEINLCHINVLTPITELSLQLDSLKNVPKVLTEHSSFYHTGIYQKYKNNPEEISKEKNRLGELLNNNSIKAIFPVSNQLGEVLINEYHVNKDKIQKIPNVASEEFCFIPKTKNKLFKICLVAIWSPPKNPFLFLEALLKIKSEIKDKISVDWIGDGIQINEIKNYVKENLSELDISFKGIIYDKTIIAKYFQDADLFVHPSDAENLPCVIIESLSCGTPVLSNSINGIKELISNSNGILTPAKDIHAFSNELLNFINGQYHFNNQKIAEDAKLNYGSLNVGKQIYLNITNKIELKLRSPKQIICKRCVLDINDDPEIEFDTEGICNYCRKYDQLSNIRYNNSGIREDEHQNLIKQIKKKKEKSKYDCILGVSGGVDSCYTAIKLVENGLNPLIVHLDNGWNSELAVKNIENLVKQLNLDFYTYVIDWEEFRDIQLSFLKASVVDIELVTDYAIVACLYNLAAEMKTKYIITGHNYATESIMPVGWTHAKSDLKNIFSIHRKFGTKKIKSFPQMSYLKKAYYVQLKKITVIPYLNYTEFNKEEAKSKLIREHGWRDYGGKHSESIFTKFYQNYILPKKFLIDKRKAHLSSLICSNQLTREEALKELLKPLYDPEELENDKAYVIKKFQLTPEEFDSIMKLQVRSHTDFASYVTSQYKYEIWLSKKLKPISRPVKKLLGIKIENNYV